MQLELKSSAWIHEDAVQQDAGATCLQELFEQWADRTPDASALVCGDVTLSYAELDARANQLARYLKSMGAGPGSFVGLVLRAVRAADHRHPRLAQGRQRLRSA